MNMIDKPEVSTDFACAFKQEVIWNNMDVFNHINNVVYYCYAEKARVKT